MSTAQMANVVGSIGGVASAATSLANSVFQFTGGSDGAWATSLRQASYGKIKFGVEQGATRAGRRSVVHDYPFRDAVWVEDLGLRARRFSITGFLLENDVVYNGGSVIAQREQLLAVIEKKTDIEQPGQTLVHPTFGRIDNVFCLDCDIIERTGRCFELRFDFIISGVRTYPAATTTTGDAVQVAAEKTRLAAMLDFTSKAAVMIADGAAITTQTVNTMMQWHAMANKLVNDVLRVFKSVSTLSGNFGHLFGGGNTGYTASNKPAAPGMTVGALIASDTAARTRVAAAGAALVAAASASNTAALGAAVVTLAQSVAASASDPGDAVRLLAELAQFTPADNTTASPTSKAMATAALTRRVVLSELAQAAARYQPSSIADAIATRNLVTRLLACEITVAGDTGDDASYLALVALQAAVVNDLKQRGARLAAMSTYAFRAAMPALVLAHRIYRDIGRTDALVRQVQAIHPAFLPGSFTALQA